MPSNPENQPLDFGSVFLGAKGENADVFEKLLLEAFRDHVFWRRNFHPEDGFLVRETEKHLPEYERSISTLSQELMGLLAELKGGVPFFSPRYIGHMNSDLTMAGVIGYFAAMLYNPNNVSAEASPVTSRLELEVAAQLAAMIGYPADGQWGHLTSGGTVANFEALWVARNVKYLPVALHWACIERSCPVSVRTAAGADADLVELDLWELLNIPPRAALDALDLFARALGGRGPAAEVVNRHSLSGLGYQEFGRRLAAEFRDALPPGVVLVPSTGHYSWEKICRSLGLGGDQLRHIPVDERFRMDLEALQQTLAELGRTRQPVIACVSVIGTTEESAVDLLHQVHHARQQAEKAGLSFYLHADAAWGGYAASVTRAADGSRRPYASLAGAGSAFQWPEEEVYRALCALEETDSTTIDPHKLGLVPYPAGAISFRDKRVRELVAVEAPYLFHGGGAEWAYIGRFIFEGSKPGASAASVWMAHKILPLDETGYGGLVQEMARGALLLHERVSQEDWGEFRLVPLPDPDLNIVCFAVGHPALRSLEASNALVDRVYGAMSAGEHQLSRQVDYFVTRTILRVREYGKAALPLVEALGFTEADYARAGGLNVIRCTVMDPFLASRRGRVDHVEGFARTLRRVLAEQLDRG